MMTQPLCLYIIHIDIYTYMPCVTVFNTCYAVHVCANDDLRGMEFICVDWKAYGSHSHVEG